MILPYGLAIHLWDKFSPEFKDIYRRTAMYQYYNDVNERNADEETIICFKVLNMKHKVVYKLNWGFLIKYCDSKISVFKEELIAAALHPRRIAAQMSQFDDMESFFEAMEC